MSHAANLRSSQRAQEVSSKKQKLSRDNARSSINAIDSLLTNPASKPISAALSQDSKALKQKQPSVSNAKVGHADGDVNLARKYHNPKNALSEDSDNGDSDESDESDESEDSEDSEEDGDGGFGGLASPPREDSRFTKDLRSPADFDSPKVNGIKGNGVDAEAEQPERRIESANEYPRRDDPQQETAEPSFGDLLRMHDGAMIDVTTQDEAQERLASENAAHRQRLAPPTANSLGTVLSQALRTNDTPLLESCLQIGNLQSIRATIERLPSQQAGDLLQKLAERMHKRPGRAGSLMVWIQWTVVAHGGYLATQPAVMYQLRELHRVVKMRANALQPLLALKGKLDMLEAQLQLRKSRAAQASQTQSGRQEGIIYIEGETSEDDSDEEAADDSEDPGLNGNSSMKTDQQRGLAFDTDEEADDVPMVNGFASEHDKGDVDADEEDDSDDEEADEEDLIDDEAEESAESEDELSGDEVEFTDADDEIDSGSDKAPAMKRSKTG